MIGLIRTLLGIGLVVVGGFFAIAAAAVFSMESQAGARGAGWFMAGVAALLLLIGVRWLRYRSAGSWRNDPASAKQKEFADQLGIHYAMRITKGELSDLISEVTGR